MKLKKVHAAEEHIEAAIRLWAQCGDPTCVVTLAGAAEEVLGNLLSRQQCDNMMKHLVSLANMHHSNVDPKELYSQVNRVRNALKHAKDDKEDEFDFEPEEARAMLLRAMVNYQLLTGELTPTMEDFLCRHLRGSWLLPNEG